MFKKIMMLLLVPTAIFSMDTDIVMTNAMRLPYPFVLLPAEICEKIAYYLDFFETDAAFFERVRDQKEVSAEHMEQLNKRMHTIECSDGGVLPDEAKGRFASFSFWRKPLKPITTYSIDQSKIIFLETRDDFFKIPARLAVVDIQTNTLVKNRFADSAMYQEQLQKASKKIHGIALSHNGAMLAEFQIVPTVREGTEKMFYKNELMVYTISGDPKRFTISEYHEYPYKIGFNKQCTKVLAYCITNNEPTLFPLVSEEEHKARSTLDAYFTRRAICKPITPESINRRL